MIKIIFQPPLLKWISFIHLVCPTIVENFSATFYISRARFVGPHRNSPRFAGCCCLSLCFYLSSFALYLSSKPHLGLPREQFSSPLLGLVEKTGVLLLLQQQHHIEVRLDNNNNNINTLYFKHNSTTRSFNSYRNDY